MNAFANLSFMFIYEIGNFFHHLSITSREGTFEDVYHPEQHKFKVHFTSYNLYFNSLTSEQFTTLIKSKLSFSNTHNLSEKQFLEAYNLGGYKDHLIYRKIIALPMTTYHLFAMMKLTTWHRIITISIIALGILNFEIFIAFSIKILILTTFIALYTILREGIEGTKKFIIQEMKNIWCHLSKIIKSDNKLDLLRNAFLYLRTCAYHSMRDLHIAGGHVITIFNDVVGTKHVHRAHLEKQCYSLNSRLKLLKTYHDPIIIDLENTNKNQEIKLTTYLINNKLNLPYDSKLIDHVLDLTGRISAYKWWWDNKFTEEQVFNTFFYLFDHSEYKSLALYKLLDKTSMYETPKKTMISLFLKSIIHIKNKNDTWETYSWKTLYKHEESESEIINEISNQFTNLKEEKVKFLIFKPVIVT